MGYKSEIIATMIVLLSISGKVKSQDETTNYIITSTHTTPPTTTMVPCTEIQFECAYSGQCIPREQVCDKNEDCYDKSDENEFICNGTSHTPLPCPSYTWCRATAAENTTYLSCIDLELICDGVVDCWHEDDNEKDEKGCPTTSPPTTTTTLPPCLGFVCNETGNCIPSELVCDGKVDCGSGDNSDEEFCPTTTTLATTTRFCSVGLVECPEGGACVEPWWICDGVRDCPQGGDEENCRP